MKLLLKVEKVIELAKIKMLNDPHHNLLAKERIPIYNVLEECFPLIGKDIRGWLAVLTAKKVLPIYQNEAPLDKKPNHTLELAEAILTGKLTIQELETNHEIFLEFLGMGLGQEGQGYSQEASAAYITPDLALAEVTGVWLYKLHGIEEKMEERIAQGFPDEMLFDVDTASEAVIAYSGSSIDWDIVYKSPNDYINDKNKILNHVRTSIHPKFNKEKRKEFWEWWLGEAIPSALTITHAIIAFKSKEDFLKEEANKPFENEEIESLSQTFSEEDLMS